MDQQQNPKDGENACLQLAQLCQSVISVRSASPSTIVSGGTKFFTSSSYDRYASPATDCIDTAGQDSDRDYAQSLAATARGGGRHSGTSGTVQEQLPCTKVLNLSFVAATISTLVSNEVSISLSLVRDRSIVMMIYPPFLSSKQTQGETIVRPYDFPLLQLFRRIDTRDVTPVMIE